MSLPLKVEEQMFPLPAAAQRVPAVEHIHSLPETPSNDFEGSIDATEQSYQDWRAASKHGAARAEQFFRDIRHEVVKPKRPGIKKIQFG